MRVEKLRPCSCDEHHGRLPEMLHEVLDERDLARLGPVDVLEDGHDRLLRAEALEEPPCCEVQEIHLRHLVVGGKPEQEREVAERLLLFAFGHEPLDGAPELLARDRRGVGLEDLRGRVDEA
jgi:hypothetical protein